MYQIFVCPEGLYRIGRLVQSQEEVDSINPTWDVEDKIYADILPQSFLTLEEAELMLNSLSFDEEFNTYSVKSCKSH